MALSGTKTSRLRVDVVQGNVEVVDNVVVTCVGGMRIELFCSLMEVRKRRKKREKLFRTSALLSAAGAGGHVRAPLVVRHVDAT